MKAKRPDDSILSDTETPFTFTEWATTGARCREYHLVNGLSHIVRVHQGTSYSSDGSLWLSAQITWTAPEKPSMKTMQGYVVAMIDAITLAREWDEEKGVSIVS